MCEYTDHGHCGLLTPDGDVANDATLERYAAIAVAQAEAGAHLVAPSGMMDGQVAVIRAALDAAGHGDVGICAYSAKYASGFYGPFREAAEGAPAFGDRASHQQDPANAAEALREVALDIGEGADMVMVKPALAYLDVIRRVADSVWNTSSRVGTLATTDSLHGRAGRPHRRYRSLSRKRVRADRCPGR